MIVWLGLKVQRVARSSAFKFANVTIKTIVIGMKAIKK